MNWTDVLLIFVGLALLVAVFELMYWLLTQRIGVVVHVQKATLVGVFWLLAMIVTFLLRAGPDLKVMLTGVVVYVLHAMLCDKFSVLRHGFWDTNPEKPPYGETRGGSGGPSSKSQSLWKGGAK